MVFFGKSSVLERNWMSKKVTLFVSLECGNSKYLVSYSNTSFAWSSE